MKTINVEELVQEVTTLYKRGESEKQIAKLLEITHGQVCKILVTAGLKDTDEARLFEQGYTQEQIMEIMHHSATSVNNRIPYNRGLYRSDAPTKNAEAVRRHLERKRAAEMRREKSEC